MMPVCLTGRDEERSTERHRRSEFQRMTPTVRRNSPEVGLPAKFVLGAKRTVCALITHLDCFRVPPHSRAIVRNVHKSELRTVRPRGCPGFVSPTHVGDVVLRESCQPLLQRTIRISRRSENLCGPPAKLAHSMPPARQHRAQQSRIQTSRNPWR